MLRNRIVPSYFWIISLLIQRPSPVPLLDFVLKNGSRSLFHFRTDTGAGRLQNGNAHSTKVVVGSRTFTHTDVQAAAIGHRLDGIANKIKEHLLQFALERVHTSITAVPSIDRDVRFLHESLFVFFSMTSRMAATETWIWLGGFAIEAESLFGNVCYTRQLFLGDSGTAPSFIVERRVFPQ